MRTGDKDGAIHARNFRRGGVGEEGWVTRSQRATTSPKTLEELGISKTQASRWPPRDRRSPRRGPLVQIHELALIEGAALEQRRSEALDRIPMRPDEFQRVMFTYPPDLVPMGPQTALDARQRVIARHLPVRIPWNLLAQFRRPFSELPPPVGYITRSIRRRLARACAAGPAAPAGPHRVIRDRDQGGASVSPHPRSP